MMKCYHEYKPCNQYALRCSKCGKIIVPHKDLIDFMRTFKVNPEIINTYVRYYSPEKDNENSAG